MAGRGGLVASLGVPAITVVIPARDAAATIGRTLSALAAQELDGEYEVIVVDSGSRDDTPAIALASDAVREVLQNPGGEPAGSRNLGVSRARGSALAFTDADCEPAPDWLAAGLRALDRAEIVQGRVIPSAAAGPFDRTLGVSGESGLYETANLFVRRDVFDRVGGFEPVLKLGDRERPFGEDAWFVWRARRTGARTAFASDALVRHGVFGRGPRAYVAERARSRYFPALVGMIPELREQFLAHRVFLTVDSARFAVAVAGLAASAVTRRRVPAIVAGATYVAHVERAARRWPVRDRPRVAATRLAADAVTFVALLRGSVAARSLVL